MHQSNTGQDLTLVASKHDHIGFISCHLCVIYFYRELLFLSSLAKVLFLHDFAMSCKQLLSQLNHICTDFLQSTPRYQLLLKL